MLALGASPGSTLAGGLLAGLAHAWAGMVLPAFRPAYRPARRQPGTPAARALDRLLALGIRGGGGGSGSRPGAAGCAGQRLGLRQAQYRLP